MSTQSRLIATGDLVVLRTSGAIGLVIDQRDVTWEGDEPTVTVLFDDHTHIDYKRRSLELANVQPAKR